MNAAAKRQDDITRVSMDENLHGAALDEALAFLRTCPSAAYLQRPDWHEYCPPPARHVYRVLRARDADGNLIGLGLARLSRMLPGRHLASLRRGPVTRTPEDLDRVIPAFADTLRHAGCASMVVNPRWCDPLAETVTARLRALGAEMLPDDEQSLHRATLLIDLSGNAEALESRLKQRCRRSIRKSVTAGLEVRAAASLDEAMQYEPILHGFHDRRKLARDYIPPAERQWDMTREAGAFLLGWYEGRVICGHVAIPDGDRLFWLSMASTDSHHEIPKNYALVWEAMLIGQAQGFARYDMAGAPPKSDVQQRAVDRFTANRNQFKMGFAPEHVDLVPMMVLPLRQPDHAILFNLRRRYRARAKSREVAS